MHLEILVPDLFWPDRRDTAIYADLSLPALGTMLARGRCQVAPHPRERAPGWEEVLAKRMGIQTGNASASATSPAAARLAGEAPPLPPAGAAPGAWVCADPVHLRFVQQQVVVADARQFPLDDADAQALVAGLNDYFAPDGIRIAAPAPDRWYAWLPQTLLDTTAGLPPVLPLSAVAGRRLDGRQPAADLPPALTRVVSDAQMVLHTHPANARREEAGHLPVNSLWLWGYGLPAAPDFSATVTDAPLSHLWADSPLARGLAGPARAAALPAGFSALPAADTTSAAGRGLVVLESLFDAALYQDRDAWRRALPAVETAWLAPALAALWAGRLAALTLTVPATRATVSSTLVPGDRWKFWRRPLPTTALAAYAAPWQAEGVDLNPEGPAA